MSDVNSEQPPAPEPAELAPPAALSRWRDMWLKPRAVLRQQLATPAHWSDWLPAMLAGTAAVLETFAISQSTAVAAGLPPLPQPSTLSLLLMALVLGPLSGLLHVGIMGFLLRHVSRLIGGLTTAGKSAVSAVTPAAMRRGISLALVPMAFSLLPGLFELWWRGQQGNDVGLTISTGVKTVLNIWFLLLLVMTVSEVLQQSIRRATLTVASTLLVLVGIFLALRGPL